MTQPTVYANKVIIQGTDTLSATPSLDTNATIQPTTSHLSHQVSNTADNAFNKARSIKNYVQNEFQSNGIPHNTDGWTLARLIIYIALSPILIPLVSTQVAYNITRRVAYSIGIDTDRIINNIIDVVVNTSRELADLMDNIFHTNVAHQLRGKYYKSKGTAKGKYNEYAGKATGQANELDGRVRGAISNAQSTAAGVNESGKQRARTVVDTTKQASTGILGIGQHILNSTVGLGVNIIYYTADTIESLAPRARSLANHVSDQQSNLEQCAQSNQSQGNQLLNNAADKIKECVNSADGTFREQTNRAVNNGSDAVQFTLQPELGELHGKTNEYIGTAKGKYADISGRVQGNGAQNTLTSYARNVADWATSQSSVTPGDVQSGLLGVVESATGNILSTAGSVLHSVADKADQINDRG